VKNNRTAHEIPVSVGMNDHMGIFRNVCTALAIFSSSALFFGQVATKPKPAFEVASIKPVGPFQMRPGIRISGNRFDCAMSLEALIITAYQINTYQITGPEWLNSQRFEINATLPEHTSKDQVPEILRTLLEDRFKLKAHFEKKDQPVYTLVVPRKGELKLMKADETVYADAKPLSPTHPINMKPDGDSFILIDSRNGMVTRGGNNGRGGTVMRMEILKTSMPAFADYLTGLVDRPVVDATGLKDFYRIMLDLPMDIYANALMSRPMLADVAAAMGNARTPFSDPASAPTATPAGNASDPPGKAVFAAIEKLGLKLDSRRAPVEMLIIERVEKSPAEN
jgi:uncharacterized protein (TIGR03435 family)